MTINQNDTTRTGGPTLDLSPRSFPMRVLLTLALTLALSACKVDQAQQCHVNGTGGSATTSGEGAAMTGTFPIVDACAIVECDPSAGEPAKKAACDDADPKTADRCAPIAPECGALCVHVAVPCDSLDPLDVQAAACEDGNPCTDGRCVVGNVCVQLPFSGGVCENDGVCSGGVCAHECGAIACANEGAECGIAFADCDGDGMSEGHPCGECAAPEACGGSDVPGVCGADCLSKYGAECAAAGSQSFWAFEAACNLAYQFGIDGLPIYCAGCASQMGCEGLDVGGVNVACCPKF